MPLKRVREETQMEEILQRLVVLEEQSILLKKDNKTMQTDLLTLTNLNHILFIIE